MAVNQMGIRQNYLAIFAAAIACFLMEVLWYGYFMRPWLDGLGGCSGWFSPNPHIHPVVQFSIAFVSELFIAAAISCVTQLSGPQTILRGLRAGALLWLGFVVTTWATQYAFELRPWSQLAINCGFWLLGMVVVGAIVGGWKKE